VIKECEDLVLDILTGLLVNCIDFQNNRKVGAFVEGVIKERTVFIALDHVFYNIENIETIDEFDIGKKAMFVGDNTELSTYLGFLYDIQEKKYLDEFSSVGMDNTLFVKTKMYGSRYYIYGIVLNKVKVFIDTLLLANFANENYPTRCISDLKGFRAVKDCGILLFDTSRFDGSLGHNPHESSYLHINEALLKKFKVSGLLSLLRKSINQELSELEDTLLTCIRWFALGDRLLEKDIGFVSYMTVLEALFNVGVKDRSVTDKISEGVAFILSKDKGKRKEIKKDIKKLYAIRSKVIHGGSTISEEDELFLARDYAGNSIIRTLEFTDKFNSINELYNYFEDLRLS